MRIVYEEDKIVYEPRFMELKLNEIRFYDNAEDVKKGCLYAYVLEYKTNKDAEHAYHRILMDGIYFIYTDDDTILSYDYPYCYLDIYKL